MRGLEKKLPGRVSLTFQLIISEKNQDFEMVTSNFDLVSTFFFLQWWKLHMRP